MSTTTVSHRVRSRNATLAALRRRQAEARAAARKARRCERIEARQLRKLNRRIAEQDTRYQELVAQLDDAARRLPDLAFSAPALPVGDAETFKASDSLSRHLEKITACIDAFESQLAAEVQRAEETQALRIRKAKAWRKAGDLERHVDVLWQQRSELADQLEKGAAAPADPARPSENADLESIEVYLAALGSHLDFLQSQVDSLRNRKESKERAAGLAGPAVSVAGADKALDQHRADEIARARAALHRHLDAELADREMTVDALPGVIRAQIEDALQRSDRQDYREFISGLLAHEQQYREGIEMAMDMLQEVPEMVHANDALSGRWQTLAHRLERIASGLADFETGAQREYEQIRDAAARQVNLAYIVADWKGAMRDGGFDVIEGGDEGEFVVLDLENPSVWLEVTELKTEDGEFAAELELKTDDDSLSDEAEVTNSVCEKLAQVAARSDPDVAVNSEVIERDPRIKRARRPALARQHFIQ